MTTQIALTLALLGATFLLFALEAFRLDVVAVLVMLSLARLRLVEPWEAFAGLASNAVVSVIAMMVLEHGLTRTGVVNALVRPILRIAGTGQRRLVAVVSLVVGTVTAFRQNVRAAAVFLLAGLIPLGTAVERSGAAGYVAQQVVGLLEGSRPLVLLLAIATHTTVSPLFMSKVAAMVLLVPLAMAIGDSAGIDARAPVLLVAVCASNSLALPTRQVHALFMAPGGYRNRDYARAGGIMTTAFAGAAASYVYPVHLQGQRHWRAAARIAAGMGSLRCLPVGPNPA